MNYQNDALLRLLQCDADTMRGACGGARGDLVGGGSSCEGEHVENGTVENGVGACLAGTSLAMVYAPVQRFGNLYEPEEGLCRGTIFQELEKPFHGGRGK